MSQIRDTLNERGSRYGRFDHHAYTARALIETMEQRVGFRSLDADQKHALCYILDKIARILEGDPDYADNWHDIAGYATLIEDRLNGTGLYAPRAATVQAANCFEPGAIIRAENYATGRCRECHAELGDAHAPDCILVSHLSNPR